MSIQIFRPIVRIERSCPPPSGTCLAPRQTHAGHAGVARHQERLKVTGSSTPPSFGAARLAYRVGVAELRRAEQPRQAGLFAARDTDVAAQDTEPTIAYRVGACA